MASKFSEEILSALRDAQPLNFAKCEEIADRFDEKARALVACAKRNGMTYERKERTTKTGDKIVSKSDLVATIATNLGITANDVDGLDKANKSALEVVAKMTTPVVGPNES